MGWGGREQQQGKASHRTVIVLCWVQGVGNLPVHLSSRILPQSMLASASHIHSQCETQGARATLALESFLCFLDWWEISRQQCFCLRWHLYSNHRLAIQEQFWVTVGMVASWSAWRWQGGWEASHSATAWQRQCIFPRENAFLKLKVTVIPELKWVCEGQWKEGWGNEGLPFQARHQGSWASLTWSLLCCRVALK